MTISALGETIQPEETCDENRETYVDNVLVQETLGTLLVVAHDVFVTERLEPGSDAELMEGD